MKPDLSREMHSLQAHVEIVVVSTCFGLNLLLDSYTEAGVELEMVNFNSLSLAEGG